MLSLEKVLVSLNENNRMNKSSIVVVFMDFREGFVVVFIDPSERLVMVFIDRRVRFVLY